VCVENNPDCARELFRLDFVKLIQADFLTCDSERLGGLFDQVVMNPPFKMGTDCKHIRHALTLLKPNGLLVSLCYNGVKQNEQLKPIATTWEVLPENSFKETGTRASVAMLTIRKGESCA
jgi:predicted RNA methylase